MGACSTSWFATGSAEAGGLLLRGECGFYEQVFQVTVSTKSDHKFVVGEGGA